MTDDQREQFRAAVTVMLDSWLWELSDEAINRIPDPVDYVEMRRQTFGSDLTMSLAKIGHAQDVPPEVYESPVITSLENSAADYACLLNDVFSYQKEIEYEGELHNGVLATEHFLHCDTAQAVAIVNDLMSARIRQFERIATVELPILCERLDVSPEGRASIDAYLEQLRDWMAGILNWHRETGRYPEPDLMRRFRPLPPRPAVFGLSGIGTAAARIAELAGP
jgi:germacradienol/geosmin synthase